MARRPPRNRQRRASQPLLASAKAVDVGSKAQVKLIEKRHQTWQPEAWAAYSSIGEIGHALDYRASIISKVRLFAAVLPDESDDEPVPVSAGARPTEDAEGNVVPPLIPEPLARLADDVMGRLENGPGVPALLSKMSLNLDVPGECHVVGEVVEDEEIWNVYSDAELMVKSGDELRVIEMPGDKEGRPLAPDATVFRVWSPNPQFSALAHSSLRPIVEEGVFSQLLILGREQRSSSVSRFANGILLIEAGLDFDAPTPEGAQAEQDGKAGGGLQAELVSVFTAAMENDGSAADAVPYVLEVPDVEKAMRHVTFGKEGDQTATEKYDLLLGRVANALPLPREITLGLGESTNHWSAALIERSGFRSYIEPAVLAMCHAFTVGFFRPMLQSAGVTDPDVLSRLVVWFDPEDALAPENRVETATKGVELNAIGGRAWRREAKFDETDAPSEDELLARLGFDRSIMTADLSLLVLKLLADAYPKLGSLPNSLAEAAPADAPIDVEVTEDDGAGEVEPDDNPVPMVAAGHQNAGDRLAAIDRGLTERIQAAADAAVEQALVRAGNRLKSMAKRDRAATAAVKDVAPELVAATLGRQWVQRLRTPAEEPDTVDDLLAGSFVALRERFVRQATAAWAATAAEALDVALPEDRPSQVELDLLDTEAAQDAERAGDRLVVALTALATALLFDPNPEVGPGEVDVTSTVPAVIVREAIAMAGGAQAVERTAVGGIVTPDGPVGGVATGARSRTLFARIRAWWTGYRWDYGDASARQRPFPPHQALSGRVFTTWDSPELANTGAEWMGTTSYRPGDHAGCRCSFSPVVLDPVPEEAAA